MDFFGARLTWPPLHELIDPNDSILDYPEDNDEKNANHDPNNDTSDDEPNDIQWDI